MVALTSPEDSGPGSWADADMLQVCNCKTNAPSDLHVCRLADAESICADGKGGTNAGGRDDGGMTLEEYRASYSIWAVLASPIIISYSIPQGSVHHGICL